MDQTHRRQDRADGAQSAESSAPSPDDDQTGRHRLLQDPCFTGWTNRDGRWYASLMEGTTWYIAEVEDKKNPTTA